MRDLLPELDELGPLVDRILATSTPDPERRWSAAGELDTVESRLVRASEVEATLDVALERARSRTEALYAQVVRALSALEAGNAVAAAEAFLAASALEERAWRMDRAEAWALAALRAVQDERDRGPAALALRRAARAARGRGGLAAAAARYEEAHAVSVGAGDARGAAVAATGRGNVDVDRGLWESAEVWYRRALGHAGLAGEEAAAERWHALQNLSIVARRMGRLDECRRWLETAEEVAGAIGDPAARVDVENGWGMWSLATGDAAGAEARFRRALDAAADPKATVTISVNLGQALLAQGRLLEAAEAARRAESEAIRSGVAVKLPEVYRLLAAVAAARGHGDAFVFLERALERISASRLPDWERAETLDAYAALREREGEGREAAALRTEAEAIRARLRAPTGENEHETRNEEDR